MVISHINYLISIKDYAQVEHLLEVDYATSLDLEIGLKLAEFYHSLSRFNEAQYTFGKICDNTPGEKKAMIGFGRSYTLIGEYDFARDFFKTYLETFPSDHDAELELAEAFIRMNELEKGRELIDKSELNEALSSKRHFLKGLLLNKKGRYYESLQNLDRVDVEDVETKLIMVDCYFQLENFQECFQLVNELMIDQFRHPMVCYWKCKELISSNELNSAFELAKKTFDQYNRLHYMENLIGEIKFDQGDIFTARLYCVSIQKITPWFGEGIGKKFLIFSHPGLTPSDKETMLNLCDDPLLFEMHYYVGRYFLEIEKDDQLAMTYFLKSISNRPEHVPSLRKLSEVSRKMGNHAQSKEFCEQILVLNPTHQWANLFCKDNQ